jgi:hypothetical protein
VFERGVGVEDPRGGVWSVGCAARSVRRAARSVRRGVWGLQAAMRRQEEKEGSEVCLWVCV